MSQDSITRRRAIKLTGAVAASAALAGCGGDDGGGDDGFDGWFEDTETFDGVVDETDASAVTVDVGVGTDGYNFDPPAIRVSAGTAVTWKWTGEGGSHNIVAEDGSFESDLVDEEGHTYERTFEASGEQRYACSPHRSFGMRGVVVVE